MTLWLVLLIPVLIGLAWGVSRIGQGDPARPLPPGPVTVEALVAAGRIIEAIKLLREETGLGLKEAKDAVDAYRNGRPLPRRTTTGTALPPAADDDELRRLLERGELVAAIKWYREQTGAGLAEAKAAVDQLARSVRHATDS